MFSTIIVPFDFTPACVGALRHAAVIAEHEGADLHCVHVYEDFLSYYEIGASTAYALDRASVAELRERLEAEIVKVEPESAERAGWTVEVLEGNPAFRIAERASEFRAPLVVLPTHGRGRFRRFLMGSVANQLLHDLDCPVLTGVHLETPERFPSTGYQQVLCAVGMHPGSESVIRAAAEFARSWEAPLTVVNAINIFRGGPVRVTEFPTDLRRYYLDSTEKEIREILTRNDIEADVRVDLQAPDEYVAKVAADLKADILVAGRGHVTGPAAPFRHRVFDLIRESPAPVLSIKESATPNVD